MGPIFGPGLSPNTSLSCGPGRLREVRLAQDISSLRAQRTFHSLPGCPGSGDNTIRGQDRPPNGPLPGPRVSATGQDNTRKPLLPASKSLVLPVSGPRLSTPLSLISYLALEVPLEAKEAGNGGSGRARIGTQGLEFLNSGRTGILSEVNDSSLGRMPMHFRCLTSLALLTECQECPPVLVTSQSIPCHSLGINSRETRVSPSFKP